MSKENFEKEVEEFLDGKILQKYNNLCEQISNNEFGNIKGRGRTGIAYLFKIIEDGDAKEYVIKKTMPTGFTRIERDNYKTCIVNNYSYKAHDGNTYTYDKAFVCESPYIEYMIGKLCTDLSINFIKHYSFALCSSTDRVMNGIISDQHILLEKADTTLSSLLLNRKLPPFDLDSIYIQIMHALCCIQQTKYKIVHGDLHFNNIFLIRVTDNTTYNGERIKDYDYIEYQVNGESFYIPILNFKYIVKLGDWGKSSKYSEPAIMDTNVSSYESIPDYYTPAYDIGFVNYNITNYETTFGRMGKEVDELIFKNKVRAIRKSDYYRDSMNMDTRTINIQAPITAFDLFKLASFQRYKKHNSNKTLICGIANL